MGLGRLGRMKIVVGDEPWLWTPDFGNTLVISRHVIDVGLVVDTSAHDVRIFQNPVKGTPSDDLFEEVISEGDVCVVFSQSPCIDWAHDDLFPTRMIVGPFERHLARVFLGRDLINYKRDKGFVLSRGHFSEIAVTDVNFQT